MTETSLSMQQQTELQKNGYKYLFSIPDFRNLLIAQFISNMGDGVYMLALIWLMKVLTGSSILMSIVLASETVPLILIGLFAGAYVDLRNKKKILLVSDITRGIIITLLTIFIFIHMIQPWMLIVGAILLSTFSAFFTPARSVAIKSIVPSKNIQKASSLSQTIQTSVGLASPALSAILISINMGVAFSFNAISFFLSFLFILFIPNKDLTNSNSGKINYTTIKVSLKEGFHAILSIPILKSLIIYIVLLNFLFAPIALLLPLYVQKSSELALTEIAFSIGMLVGSVAIGMLDKIKKVIPIILGLFLVDIGLGILPFVHQLYFALMGLILAGFGLPLVNVTTSSLFIIKVDREVLGRASSMMNVLSRTAMPVSLLITGFLIHLTSVRDLFIGISILSLLVLVFMVLNPIIRKAS